MKSRRLRSLISGRIDDVRAEMCARDLFATGCYLHRLGKVNAGLKNIATALVALEVSKVDSTEIFESLPGNEIEFFEAASPHSELEVLLAEMRNIDGDVG